MRRGFTLIELVLVVMVLAIVGGLAVPMLGGLTEISTPTGPKSDRRIVTETSMQRLRDAFLSSEARSGIWSDLGHVPNRLPRTVAQLFGTDAPLAEATPFVFNPVTKIGWRGPYLSQPTGNYPDVTTIHSATGNTWADDNFTEAYGDPGDLEVVDAWGNPIVLQIDFDGNDVIDRTEASMSRLVSAGPDGIIDLANLPRNQTDYLAALQSHQTDDVVIYLGLTQ